MVEMDIESYFDKRPLDRMMLLIEKKVEKQGKGGIMKTENAVNTVVEPYL